MKTTIYYFSSTGNCLYGARKLAEQLDEAEIISIAERMRSGEKIIFPPGRVGIVCPDYAGGIPLIVSEFIRKADMSAPEYLFIVITYGSMAGEAESLTVDAMAKAGRAPDYITKIKMADNNLIAHNPPAGEELKQLMVSASDGFRRAGEQIARREKRVPKGNALIKILSKAGYSLMMKQDVDKNFHVDENCNGCGTCERACPVVNITMENKKPVWHHHCEYCQACIHLCPKAAIQYKNSTQKKGRYRNPEVPLKDLMRTN